jgi:hypothetical protein
VLENVAKVPAQCYVIPYHNALIYHFLGDKEKTLLTLEEAFEQRDLWLVWIGIEPASDELRDACFAQASLFVETGYPGQRPVACYERLQATPTYSLKPSKR